VLVVKPDALEPLATATCVVFDKTGTLTEPRIAIDRTRMLRAMDRDEAVAIAAALAQGSRHPLARAFANVRSDSLPVATERESLAGRGIGGVIDGRRFRLGRTDFALPWERARAELEDAVVLADDDGRDRGVRHRRKPAAGRARRGRRAGPRRHEGRDRERRREVEGRARRRGARDRHLGRAPDAGGQARRARCDAGRRASASSSSATASTTRRCSPRRTSRWRSAPRPTSRRRRATSCSPGRSARSRTRERSRSACWRILRQNRRWALAYNLAAVPLAALGLVPPWLAALGMSLSSIAVVLNAMRVGATDDVAAPAVAEPELHRAPA
jgi:Cu2+-exporting ATPase